MYHQVYISTVGEHPSIDQSATTDKTLDFLAERAGTSVTVLEGLTMPLTMDDDLLFILGRPNFMCGTVAQIMRASGIEIKENSEDEQAHVLLLMLNAYLQHGKDWKTHMEQQVEGMLAQARANEIIKG